MHSLQTTQDSTAGKYQVPYCLIPIVFPGSPLCKLNVLKAPKEQAVNSLRMRLPTYHTLPALSPIDRPDSYTQAGITLPPHTVTHLDIFHKQTYFTSRHISQADIFHKQTYFKSRHISKADIFQKQAYFKSRHYTLTS